MLEMLCDHSLKNSFPNFSSSVMYILLNKYFCKKTGLLFWLVAVNTFTFPCVFDMRIVLLKWNVKRSWSDSQSSSGDVVHVFMSSLRRHPRFSVCVLKENACLCHPFIHKYDRALNGHQIA